MRWKYPGSSLWTRHFFSGDPQPLPGAWHPAPQQFREMGPAQGSQTPGREGSEAPLSPPALELHSQEAAPASDSIHRTSWIFGKEFARGFQRLGPKSSLVLPLEQVTRPTWASEFYLWNEKTGGASLWGASARVPIVPVSGGTHRLGGHLWAPSGPSQPGLRGVFLISTSRLPRKPRAPLAPAQKRALSRGWGLSQSPPGLGSLAEGTGCLRQCDHGSHSLGDTPRLKPAHRGRAFRVSSAGLTGPMARSAASHTQGYLWAETVTVYVCWDFGSHGRDGASLQAWLSQVPSGPTVPLSVAAKERRFGRAQRRFPQRTGLPALGGDRPA